MKARTYISFDRGAAPVRVGCAVSSLEKAEARLSLIAAHSAIHEGEVRITLPDGSELLHAVVARRGGCLLLRRTDGTETVLSAH